MPPSVSSRRADLGLKRLLSICVLPASRLPRQGRGVGWSRSSWIGLEAPLAFAFAFAVVVAVAVTACDRPVKNVVITQSGTRPKTERDVFPDVDLVPLFGDRLRLVKQDLTITGPDGKLRVRGPLTFLVVGELAGRQLSIELVETATDGHGENGPERAHQTLPLTGLSPPVGWVPGDVVVVDIDAVVDAPQDSAPVSRGSLWLAIRDRGQRLQVKTVSPTTRSRLLVGPYNFAPSSSSSSSSPSSKGGKASTATITVPRVPTGSITIDGVVDEALWRDAALLTLRPTITPAAAAPSLLSTRVRLLWDDEALYLAWDIDDDDPHSPYQLADDPLYEGEAYELFLDVDGDDGAYAELQSNFRDVHFDASFRGGPRKGMNIGWSSGLMTSTTTLADGSGLVAEWRVPFATLPDLPKATEGVGAAANVGKLRQGHQLRANLFRLERRRHPPAVEATAWSPPERPDFHATDRFGTLILGPPSP